MLDIKSYPQIVSYDDVKIFCKNLSSKLKELTELQDEVVRSTEFWNKNKNLLIQSTAGTGKTLLPLIALISNTIENRKMLYLVPYRALLNEKYTQFRQYFSNENKIYRSSSDYFENDNEIFDGNCDIAIIIYEKLENYLQFNKNAERIFANYDLIVFDELSVLTTINRGLRVHYIFKQFIKYADQSYGMKHARIIGLTVPGCNIPSYDYLDFFTFIKHGRPIEINEAIYQVDEQCFYPKKDEYIWPFEIKVLYPKKVNMKNEWRVGEEESDIDAINNRLILQQLVLKHRSLNHNIIIFCNNKIASRGIAKYIADTIRVNCPIYGDWSSDLKNIKEELDDNAYGCIDSKLLYCSRYGVMIHNAELPNELRIRVEQEFSRRSGKSRINILVSTETLAYGINCSADVVIVYNRTKITEANDYPCMNSSYGDYYWRYINCIEYQNYIGRAGRLGFHQSKSIMPQEGFAYMLTRNEDATRIVRKIYFENDFGKTYNCLELFARKIKNDVHECVIDILDYIDLRERQMFIKKDIEDIICNLAGKKFIGKNIDYAEIILNDMIKFHLIEDEGEGEYSLTSQGEALKGKHISYKAVCLFKIMYYYLNNCGKYGFSSFLYFFEMFELVDSADYNLIPRKKEQLKQFVKNCNLYIIERYESGKINDLTQKYLISQIDNCENLIDDLDIVNEEGFCYINGELAKIIRKFGNSILLSEWSEGILLKDIKMKYNIRISLGYIQNVVNNFIYLSDCFEDYVKSMACQDLLINELEKTKLEIKYGYPYSYINASKMKLYIPYRPLIAELLKHYDKNMVDRILEEFVETDEFSFIHNSRERIHTFRKFLKKYEGDNYDTEQRNDISANT